MTHMLGKYLPLGFLPNCVVLILILIIYPIWSTLSLSLLFRWGNWEGINIPLKALPSKVPEAKIHFKTMNLYKIKMRSPNRVNNEKNQYMKIYIRIPYAIYNVLIDMHIHLNISLISTVFSMIFFPQKYTILLYSLIDYYVRN